MLVCSPKWLGSSIAVLLAGYMVVACKEKKDEKPDAAPKETNPTVLALLGVDSGVKQERDAGSEKDAGIGAAAVVATVAETDAKCPLVYGPVEVAVRGPGALVVHGLDRTDILVHEAGEPRMVPILHGPKAKAEAPRAFVSVSYPPCAAAGEDVYCAAPGGNLQRRTTGQPGTFLVSDEHLKGTRFSAAPLGAGSVVAWLEQHRSAEGANVQQAWVRYGDGPLTRLSEDGAGATSISLISVPGGGDAKGKESKKVLAVYIDSRTSMTPVHGRWLSDDRGRLVLGKDEVVFVGSPPERNTAIVAAALTGAKPGERRGFALLPISKDVSNFGLGVVPVLDPPKVDSVPIWSDYPNGLDPAPIAVATATDAKAENVYLARVRPETAASDSPRVLELASLDRTGVVTSLGLLDRGHPIDDLAIATEQVKDTTFVSVLYGDATHGFFQRRACKNRPAAK